MQSIILFVVWAGTQKLIYVFRHGKNIPKSAKCALSVVLLRVAMAMLVE